MASPLEVVLNVTDAQNQKLKQEIEPFLERLLKRADEPSWKPYHKKKGYEVFWMKTDESPVITIKSEGIVNGTVAKLHEFFKDFCYSTPVLDIIYIEGKTFSEYQGHAINYASYKMPPLISTRDFTMHTYDDILEDGTGISMGRSIEVDELPERPGYVRAMLNPSGYIFRALPGDPSKCFVQYIVNADIKGWIPHWVVNALAGDQGQNIRRLQAFFDKAQADVDDEKGSEEKTEAEKEVEKEMEKEMEKQKPKEAEKSSKKKKKKSKKKGKK